MTLVLGQDIENRCFIRIGYNILTLIFGFYSTTTLLSPPEMVELTQQKSIHPDVPDAL